MAAKKKNTAGMAFLVKALKRNPKVQYAVIKAKADKKGLTIYPIMYGRAQALLGIVKSAKRGEGKYARAKRGEPTRVLKPARRGKSTTGKGGGAPPGLENLVELVRAQSQERERLRDALEAVRTVVEDVLA